MTHEIEKTDLQTRPTVEEIDGHATWSHTGPHVINTGVVDGEVSFDLDPEDRD